MSDPILPADALATPEALRVAVLYLNAEVAALRGALPQTAEALARLAVLEAILPTLQQRVDALDAMPDPDTSGPSWSWLNPGTWWDRAGAENGAASLKVFRGIVFLAAGVWLLYRIVGFAERYIDAAERTADAAEQAAGAAQRTSRRPSDAVQITVPDDAVIDSTETP